MDPCRFLRHTRRTRFPRPRGDGPSSSEAARQLSWVSPPTRGWTLLSGCQGRPRRGFPAHAGMDRQHPGRPEPGHRFPRPRGDGPFSGCPRTFSDRVSPPTRGWTSASSSTARNVRGFPAHAGMDRQPDGVWRIYSGFPRPRGDGPCSSPISFSAFRVSPPTRGWTRVQDVPTKWITGFPAHAGMDLSRSLGSMGPPGFPRPRGDGPASADRRRDAALVSPPTRGWTVEFVPVIHTEGGFPAHAGMDPQPPRGSVRASWFPRPRGDGPITVITFGSKTQVSPPTRGWT